MCCIKHDQNHTMEYYETVKKKKYIYIHMSRKCSGVFFIFVKEKWKSKKTEQKTVLNLPKKGYDAKCVCVHTYMCVCTHTHTYAQLYLYPNMYLS